ncbi:MAG: hypothetical protein LAP86_03550 [Acidobacteriia bacterium]|nr:hypothetical protein [Terriglobia bacterium]
MATSISWKLNVNSPSGPKLALSSAISVDAHDRIAGTVPTAAAQVEVEVDVQLRTVGRVRSLVVRSDVYGDNLKYKVHATRNPEQTMNDTLVLGGEGSLALLGAQIDRLSSSTPLGHDANLQILVGRQAT